jgi:hypothetical protein
MSACMHFLDEMKMGARRAAEIDGEAKDAET